METQLAAWRELLGNRSYVAIWVAQLVA